MFPLFSSCAAHFSLLFATCCMLFDCLIMFLSCHIRTFFSFTVFHFIAALVCHIAPCTCFIASRSCFAAPRTCFIALRTCCIYRLHHMASQSEQRTMGSSSSTRRTSQPSQQQHYCRRSLSPERPRYPPKYFLVDKPAFTPRRTDFQAGTAGRVYSACAVCLGRHPHKIVNCTSVSIWDNSHLALAIRSNKILSIRDGRPVCGDWQCASGCPSSTHDIRHYCSSCAASSHGAQDCPRAQKILGSNTI